MHPTILRRAPLILALLVVGCSGASTPPAGPGSGSGSGTAAVTPGGEGTICRAGEHRGPDNPVEARPCEEGLQCCYPCGIQGCDSVCMADCGPPRP